MSEADAALSKAPTSSAAQQPPISPDHALGQALGGLTRMWGQVASQLLLMLPAEAPGYTVPMFDTSLAVCQFSDYEPLTQQGLGMSGGLGATVGATPLFSITQGPAVRL
jgi:hypothetical protein